MADMMPFAAWKRDHASHFQMVYAPIRPYLARVDRGFMHAAGPGYRGSVMIACWRCHSTLVTEGWAIAWDRKESE
jgi:hypothetical protein